MRVWMIAVAALAFCSDANAELYKVNARRLSSNFYELERGKAYALTRHCYEYTYGEEVFDDGDNEIIFDGGKCDVKRILVPKSQAAGAYKVRVAHEVDDLYEVDYQGVYLKTDYCYQYRYGEEAILDWNGAGGTLIFDRGRTKCQVSKILGASR